MKISKPKAAILMALGTILASISPANAGWDPIKNTPFDPGTWSGARDQIIKNIDGVGFRICNNNKTAKVYYKAGGRNNTLSPGRCDRWSNVRPNYVEFDRFTNPGYFPHKVTVNNNGDYYFKTEGSKGLGIVKLYKR